MQTTKLPVELTERIEREAIENDVIFHERPDSALDMDNLHYAYAAMLDWALEQLPKRRGLRVLDVGCGEGQSSVLLSRRGAEVTAIDVSRAALERAIKLASRQSARVVFYQTPGEDLRFDAESFDAILCISAFHHMDLPRAAQEFARVLRPGGRAIFVEPLASCPPAWLYRHSGRLLNRIATSKETPLRVRDLKFLKQHFDVRWQGMFLLSIGLIGLERLWSAVYPLTRKAFPLVHALDAFLLKIPAMQRAAWKIGIVADRC